MQKFQLVCSLSIAAALATTVSAQTVIIPSAVTATSSNASYPIDNVRNGVGMVNTTGDVSTWTHNDDNAGNWLGATGGQTLIFTLPAASTVGALHCWQYDRNSIWNDRGINTFDISFSTDGGSSYPTTITGLFLDRALEAGTVTPVQTLSFAQQLNVTHIKLANLTNFGDTSWYGLGEMYFGEGTAGGIAPSWGALDAVNITETSADLLGQLGGADSDVSVFWDTEDRGMSFTWAHTNTPPDAFTNTTMGTVVSNHVSGLTPGQTNYFAFYASNATDAAWAFSSFQPTPRGPVIQPFSASNLSWIGSAGRTADKLVDGSGLSGVGDILTQTHGVAGNNTADYWLSDFGNPGTNTFVLPGVANVDGIYVWQYNRGGSPNRQVVSFSLAFSDDAGASYSTPISGLALDTNAGGAQVLAQAVPFDPRYDVTHIRMLDMVNGGDTLTGLCEARFRRGPRRMDGVILLLK